MIKNTESLLVQPLANYADLFQENFFNFEEKGNKIASPLGAWVLLALTAGAGINSYSAEERDALEKILGESLEKAFASAIQLLNHAPKEVRLVAASWVKDRFSDREDVTQWLNELLKFDVVSSKAYLPSQAEADEWAATETLDLIKTFPVDMTDEDLMFVLTTAIVTKIGWVKPFEEVEDVQEMDSWKQKSVLFSNHTHETFLFEEPDGIFCVHFKMSDTEEDFKLKVISVIGPDNVPAERVAKLANQVAADFESYRTRQLSLFEIDINKNLSYLKIEEVEKVTMSNKTESISTFVPAWEAESTFDITDLGYVDAAKGITRDPYFDVQAIQVAVATYNKKGFEAAAISAMSIRAAALPPRPELRLTRSAKVFFSHEYAVVALVGKPYLRKQDVDNEDTIWQNIPAFVAWVNTAAAVID
jgi:hypothetical protein